MKLHRFAIETKTQQTPLVEASGAAYEVILDRVAKSGSGGSGLNEYDVFVLGNLVWFFASGRTSTNGQLDGIVNIESNATTTEMVEYIRSLSAAEVTALALELDWMLRVGNRASAPELIAATPNDPIEWMQYVLKRQD